VCYGDATWQIQEGHVSDSEPLETVQVYQTPSWSLFKAMRAVDLAAWSLSKAMREVDVAGQSRFDIGGIEGAPISLLALVTEDDKTPSWSIRCMLKNM